MRERMAVADRKALAVLGFVMGGITAAILAVGAAVVQRHLDGRLTLDARPVQAEHTGTVDPFSRQTTRAQVGVNLPALALLIPRPTELQLAMPPDSPRV